MACVVDTNVVQRKYTAPNSDWIVTFPAPTPTLCSEVGTHYTMYPIHSTRIKHRIFVRMKKKTILPSKNSYEIEYDRII